MKSLLLITFSFLTLFSCNNTTNNNSVTKTTDTTQTKKSKSLDDQKISWLDSSKEFYAVDSLLTHRGTAFHSDSVLAVDYTGFIGEHTFMPLNEKGQWINTITKIKKLSIDQVKFLQSILGNKKSFDNPMDVFCYEPRLGIVYFKEGKVIGQSAICLSCARLESTAKLGNHENYSSFNKATMRAGKALH